MVYFDYEDCPSCGNQMVMNGVCEECKKEDQYEELLRKRWEEDW